MTSRSNREPPPPSRWGRSPKGTYFYVIHTTKRDSRGRKLYRMRYREVTGSRLWTMQDLEECGARWLKRKPRGF